jgi:hypothetical protein
LLDHLPGEQSPQSVAKTAPEAGKNFPAAHFWQVEPPPYSPATHDLLTQKPHSLVWQLTNPLGFAQLEPMHVVMPMAVALVQKMQEAWFSRLWYLPTAQKTHTFLPGL